MLTNSNPAMKSSNPTREEIELRAFQIFIERGGADGHDVDDWVQAEQEQPRNTRTAVGWRKRRADKSLTMQLRAVLPS